jgi:hypothetical protein
MTTTKLAKHWKQTGEQAGRKRQRGESVDTKAQGFKRNSVVFSAGGTAEQGSHYSEKQLPF